MKYVRFIDVKGKTRLGVFQAENRIELYEGDLLGEHESTGKYCQLDDVERYLAPVDPPNIIAVGLNYRAHAAEFNDSLPERPVLFLKATTTVTGHLQPIVLPEMAPYFVDYEAELAAVIGKKCKNVPVENVADYILGYTCANDVTARDCQQKLDKQWARAKSFDTFCPLGPVLETEVDVTNLGVRSVLNGEVMQEDNTLGMIFTVDELVSYISRNMALLPGTIILTGTPSGVGFARPEPVSLQVGDKIVIEIEGIGRLENPVVNWQGR